MAPVGSVPAASPTTYIDSGTVASDMLGASVAPTIDPVAKMTAELAPVRACAAASRATLERARASPAVSSVTFIYIIGSSAPCGPWDGAADLLAALWRGAPGRSTAPGGRGACRRRTWRQRDGRVDPGWADMLLCRPQIFGVRSMAVDIRPTLAAP